MTSECEPDSPVAVWRIFFLRSLETFRVQEAPLRPLLVKELWEILGGRALWTMLLLMCPLIGYSFFQAVSLYGEASAAGLQSPVLANSLSPLDGVLVPTFGASYVAFTIGSWVLDFTVAGHPGILDWIARLSLTQVLRTFEQGLLSLGLVVGIGAALCGFAALANVWLPLGTSIRTKILRSTVCVFVT